MRTTVEEEAAPQSSFQHHRPPPVILPRIRRSVWSLLSSLCPSPTCTYQVIDQIFVPVSSSERSGVGGGRRGVGDGAGRWSRGSRGGSGARGPAITASPAPGGVGKGIIKVLGQPRTSRRLRPCSSGWNETSHFMVSLWRREHLGCYTVTHLSCTLMEREWTFTLTYTFNF